MMLALVLVSSISGLVSAQTSQAGAKYLGARPVLNKSNCSSVATPVDVQFDLIVSAAPTNTTGTIVQPVGVLYVHDSEIPAAVVNPATTTGPNGQQIPNIYVSPVQCPEPTAANILTPQFTGRDNILLTPGTITLTLRQQQIQVTVNALMEDLCNSADGGVRKRRAICFGIRNGQGGTTVVRAGDGPDIDTQIPGEPTRLTAQDGDEEIQLSVTPPNTGDAVERAQMRYRVKYRQCTPEQGLVDAGTPDAAVAPVQDAGMVDAGGTDGGDTDGGTPDAGVPDAAVVVEELGPCGAYTDFPSDPLVSPVRVTGLQNGVTYQFSTGATKKKKSSSLTAQATTPIAHSIDPIQRAVDDGRRKLRMAETRHNPELDAVFGR